MQDASNKQRSNTRSVSNEAWRPNSQSRRNSTFMLCFIFGIFIGFSIGAVVTNAATISHRTSSSSAAATTICPPCPVCQKSVKTAASVETPLKTPLATEREMLQSTTKTTDSTTKKTWRQSQQELFPESMSHYMVGMSRVDRNEFRKGFDIGYAWDKTIDPASDVMILYGTTHSMPSQRKTQNATQALSKMKLEDAVENCHTMKLVYTQPVWIQNNGMVHSDRECLAIVPQWASFNVHRFQRLYKGAVRTYGKWTYRSARDFDNFYDPDSITASNKALVTYLPAIENALKNLRPLAEKAALGTNTNTTTTTTISSSSSSPGAIIILVTNFGQSNLLLNLVCSAKSRGVDLGRFLLFATDKETYELAQHMSIHVFYDPVVFSSIPKEAGADYASHNYAFAMMGKVYSVHLALLLGYDLLFMDVDITVYKNPLDLFDKVISHEYDIYFQHDGYHHPDRFAPLAANTGVYFVRNNNRTLHFFDNLVRMGDQILLAKSHQAVVTVLANEHMGRTGLRVKVLNDYEDLMPNGWALQTGRRIVKYMRAQYGPQLPYLFHPNWRTKERKREAFISTSNWFVNDTCYDVGSDELKRSVAKAGVLQSCCLAKPQQWVDWSVWDKLHEEEDRKFKLKREQGVAKK